VIVALNGRRVGTQAELIQLLQAIPAGRAVAVDAFCPHMGGFGRAIVRLGGSPNPNSTRPDPGAMTSGPLMPPISGSVADTLAWTNAVVANAQRIAQEGSSGAMTSAPAGGGDPWLAWSARTAQKSARSIQLANDCARGVATACSEGDRLADEFRAEARRSEAAAAVIGGHVASEGIRNSVRSQQQKLSWQQQASAASRMSDEYSAWAQSAADAGRIAEARRYAEAARYWRDQADAYRQR
jgi:hypothetical protein